MEYAEKALGDIVKKKQNVRRDDRDTKARDWILKRVENPSEMSEVCRLCGYSAQWAKRIGRKLTTLAHGQMIEIQSRDNFKPGECSLDQLNRQLFNSLLDVLDAIIEHLGGGSSTASARTLKPNHPLHMYIMSKNEKVRRDNALALRLMLKRICQSVSCHAMGIR